MIALLCCLLFSPLLRADELQQSVETFEALIQRLASEPAVSCQSTSGEEELCVKPSEQFCQPETNPGLKALKDVRVKIYEAGWAAEADPQNKVARYLARIGKKSCTDLMTAQFTECAKLRDQAIIPVLFNAEAKARAQRQFDEAREIARSYILRRVMPDAPETDREDWQESLTRLSRLKLVLPDESPRGLAQTNQIEGDIVSLGTTGLLTDGSPDQLLFTLLHEFSHTTNFAYRWSSGGPMKHLQECLGSASSIGAKQADPNCLEQAAKRFAKKYPKKASELRKAAKKISVDPLRTWTLSAWPRSEPVFCSNCQHDEAQADYFAVEEFVEGRLNQLADSVEKKNAILNFIAGRCNNYADNKSTHFEASLGGVHPLPEDRIDRIIFAHPAVRAAMGCKTSEKTPNYCGGTRR